MAAKGNDMSELVKVPQELRGLVKGKGGKYLQKIEAESGVKRIEVKGDGVHLRGTLQQIEKARQMISSIIQAKECKAEKDVNFDHKFSGCLIGPGGATIRRIQKETGTHIRIDRDTGVAHITGSTQELVDRAEQKILELVSQKQEETISWEKKDVEFPAGLVGLLIGPQGTTLRGIQDETGTEIWIDAENLVAKIKGPTQEKVQDAEQRIKTLVLDNDAHKKAHSHQCRHKPERFALVDNTCIGQDNYFKLQPIKTDHTSKINYELVMEGDTETEEKEMDYISELKEALLKVLRQIRKMDDIGNIRTDMWCHFGHAHIHSVDEEDAGQTYELQEINENLQDEKNSPWKVYFDAGVKELEYKALEEALEGRALRVEPNTRFDYTFISPTRHRIRFKAFVPDSNESEDGCFSFQDDIVPIKNTLADQSSFYKYRLCAPSQTRLKVDILIPFLTFDCHLVLRTTMKEVKDVSQQEEDQTLINFLDENLKYENKNVTLPLNELPSGFSVVYRRRANRWTYPCSYPDADDTKTEFNVMISKEDFQAESPNLRSMKEDVQTKVGVTAREYELREGIPVPHHVHSLMLFLIIDAIFNSLPYPRDNHASLQCLVLGHEKRHISFRPRQKHKLLFTEKTGSRLPSRNQPIRFFAQNISKLRIASNGAHDGYKAI